MSGQGWYKVIEFVEDPCSADDRLLVRFYSLEAGGIEKALAIARDNFDALDREVSMSREEAEKLMEELEKQGYKWDEEGIFLIRQEVQ